MDGFFNFRNALVQRLGDLAVGDVDFFGNSSHQIPSPHRIILGGIFQFSGGRAHFNFDLLGGPLSNQNVVLSAHVFFDVRGELIPGHANVFVRYDAAQCDDRNLRSASSDVNDHVSHRLFDVDADPYGCGHGLMDQVNILSPCVLGTIGNRPFFNFGDARWNANDHAQ